MEKNKMNVVFTTPIVKEPSYSTSGVVKAVFDNTIKFSVGKITYELFENDQFQYVFEPYWDIIDALPSSLFQGIPGLDLSIKKNQYYRVNMTPTFITERTPSKNREDLWEFLGKTQLNFYNQLEWLIRSNSLHSGDNLIVERYREPRLLTFPIDFSDVAYGDVLKHSRALNNNIYANIKEMLVLAGNGVNVEWPDFSITGQNRTIVLGLLLIQYQNACQTFRKQQQEGIAKAKKLGKYKGRKKITIDDSVMDEVCMKLSRNEIIISEAMKETNIRSRTTFYRRYKEFVLSHPDCAKNN